MITREQVEDIGNLCKLKFTEEEKDKLVKGFKEILEYVEILNKVDTENVESTVGVNDHTQRLREDMVLTSLTREEVLQNAVEDQYGYFKLLRIVE